MAVVIAATVWRNMRNITLNREQHCVAVRSGAYSIGSCGVQGSGDVLRHEFVVRVLLEVRLDPSKVLSHKRDSSGAGFLYGDLSATSDLGQNGEHTTASFAAEKGISTIVRAKTRHSRAFLWKEAPGNQAGTNLRIGKASTRNAPGTPAAMRVCTPSVDALMYGSSFGWMVIPYENDKMVSPAMLQLQSAIRRQTMIIRLTI